MKSSRAFAIGPGARDRKKLSPIPSSLVGCWQGGGARWKLAETGVWSQIVGPYNWSVSDTGQQLVWSGQTFTRVAGSGTTYIGVWRGTDSGEPIDVSFNADGTYQWRWVNSNDSTYGYYVVSGNILTAYEKRGEKSATENTITFDTVWGDHLTGTYTLTGDNWHIVWDNGDKTDYTKITC